MACGCMQQQRHLNLWQHDGACACMICLQGQENRNLKLKIEQLKRQTTELKATATVTAEQVQHIMQEQIMMHEMVQGKL